jgi:hypothetical protein
MIETEMVRARCQGCSMRGSAECEHCMPRPRGATRFQSACQFVCAILLTPVFVYLFLIADIVDWLGDHVYRKKG